jgi:predicted nucleic acid-binding protein
MPERRRICPDNSVMVESLLAVDSGTVVARRAGEVLRAIDSRAVVAFAPDCLIVEFVKVAHQLIGGRRQVRVDPDVINDQVEAFLQLPIEYKPSLELVSTALDHARSHQIATADAWYLAVAEHFQAELWISHRHRDGFADYAAAVYPRVYVLSEDNFRRPRARRR